MMPRARTVLSVMIGAVVLSLVPAARAVSEQPIAPDNQPAAPKVSTEPAPPQPPPSAKPEPPKLSTEPPKPSAPAAGPEPPPDREVKDKAKDREKETIHKKPVVSLILRVKLALLADPRLLRYEIDVEEDQQTVTLGGRVSTDEEKAAAAEVAQSLVNGKSVINKLDVDKSLAQALIKKQDETITGLIKERFARSATLKAANFEVKTEEGVVSISGAVRFQVLALEAAEAARQVPGVKAVKTDRVRLEGEG